METNLTDSCTFSNSNSWKVMTSIWYLGKTSEYKIIVVPLKCTWVHAKFLSNRVTVAVAAFKIKIKESNYMKALETLENTRWYEDFWRREFLFHTLRPFPLDPFQSYEHTRMSTYWLFLALYVQPVDAQENTIMFQFKIIKEIFM